jgi:hypothetical protein
MNKFITILSVLLFVTYANATEKVSYSEIVNSLAEITKVQGAPDLVKSISSAFNQSYKQLEGFNSEVRRQCSAINENGKRKTESTQRLIASVTKNIASLTKHNASLAARIILSKNSRKANKARREVVVKSMQTERVVKEQRSLNLVQRKRILRRLRNLIRDELNGKQRSGTVNSFKVNNSASKFSFVELHNELEELEAHDAVTKSMITTLILITRNPNGNFANQQNVGKVLNLINQIMLKDQLNYNLFVKSSNQRRALLKLQRNALTLAIDGAKQRNSQRRITIHHNKLRIASNQTELVNLQKAIKRNQTRQSSNTAACKKHEQVSDMQKKHFTNGQRRFDELLRLLA